MGVPLAVSAIGVFRFDEDGGDLHDRAVGIFHEDDPVRADFLPQPSLPLAPAQGLYVAPFSFVFLSNSSIESVQSVPSRHAGIEQAAFELQ